MYQKELAKHTNDMTATSILIWKNMKIRANHRKNQLFRGVSIFFIAWGGLIFLLGILLGRAVLLAELFPFALPFFAAVYAWRRDKGIIAASGVVVGTFSGAIFHGAFIVAAISIFIFLYEWITRYGWRTSWALPVTVFFATAGARLGTGWLDQGSITPYEGVIAGVEGGLSFILTMIFLQSLPLLMTKKRKQPLKHEEIVCFIILLASVMTGAIGWVIYGMAAEHILARYLVLIFAFTGGAAIGAPVGVVTGLVLSLASVANLYQMSLLAFAGLLGGLLKEGKKIGVSIGMLLGTALIALYGDGMNGASLTLAESAAAIALFILTPKALTAFIERYIPGTPEYAREQQKHMQKMKDITSLKVDQFSQLFKTLSKSFLTHPAPHEEITLQQDTDELLSKITEKTCQTCFRKERCWVNQFQETYDGMTQMLDDIEETGRVTSSVMKSWKEQCHYAKRVTEVMKEEIKQDQARKVVSRQVQESRRLVADQLRGVSEVMENFAKDIQRDKETHFLQEEQIYDALHDVGVDIGHIEVYRLNEGGVEIEMSVPKQAGAERAEKIIAPLLSDVLKEHIIVEKEEMHEELSDYSNFTFASARTYTVDTGTASVAKGGGWLSGDSHVATEISAGKYIVALSDGMGSGQKAYQESNSALQLLQTILASGMDETTAIRSINSILSLRSAEEMYSTLDLVMIDLQEAQGRFIKIGSLPTFICRGKKIKQVEAQNLPIGMIEHAEVDVINEQLKEGDLLIMVSDGILEIPGPIENKEIWIKRLLSQLDTDDPQEAADLLLEEVMRVSDGNITDDMTILAARIRRNTPRWAAIPVRQRGNLKKKA
ncbi:stage II sporulation protein E [Alteribacillus sp. HJP-4]|uniref:stage II sporulation protein E n=1 Tax=Alteribacillus sp. HJP-4 TaxID=2775394 RepID=UPI0035CCF652